MRITLQSGSESIPLAGETGVSDREHSGAADLAIEPTAQVDIIRRVRADYAVPVDRGNLRTQIRFSTARQFPTAAEAETFCEDYPDSTPRTGTVILDTGGGKRKLLSALVLPPMLRPIGAAALITYVALGTEIKPAEPEIIIPDRFDDSLLYRVVDDGDEKWFEVGFLSPTNDLLGDAANGWTDAGGNILLRIERSEDLINWDHDLIPAPSSPEAVGDGDYIYWARLKYPVDSMVKSGQIRASSGMGGIAENGNISPDARNNPITGITINNVLQSLASYPYTMPTDAAELQVDLRAIGWTGATVTASSATVWEIIIPNVEHTSYQITNKVSWPGYLVPDMYGNLTITLDSIYFAGVFYNEAGVRTGVRKQFARMAVSAGPNYQY